MAIIEIRASNPVDGPATSAVLVIPPNPPFRAGVPRPLPLPVSRAPSSSLLLFSSPFSRRSSLILIDSYCERQMRHVYLIDKEQNIAADHFNGRRWRGVFASWLESSCSWQMPDRKPQDFFFFLVFLSLLLFFFQHNTVMRMI